MSRILILTFLLLQTVHLLGQQKGPLTYGISSSQVSFTSDAPQERITAESKSVRGALDPVARTFAIVVPVESFVGFNSPLQREHFNENYMESNEFPNIVFRGRIVENVDLREIGTHEIRANGVLAVHGVEKERIIDCRVTVAENTITVKSEFQVRLRDHGIHVPRIVEQKIAPMIIINTDLRFQPSEDQQ